MTHALVLSTSETGQQLAVSRVGGFVKLWGKWIRDGNITAKMGLMDGYKYLGGRSEVSKL